MPLSDADLAAIEAREQAATPGPWTVTRGVMSTYVGSADDELACKIQDFHHRDGHETNSAADGAFIAASRTDVPALLEGLRELRAAVLTHIRLRYSGDTTEQILRSLDDQAGLSPELAADFAAEARMIRLALGQDAPREEGE